VTGSLADHPTYVCFIFQFTGMARCQAFNQPLQTFGFSANTLALAVEEKSNAINYLGEIAFHVFFFLIIAFHKYHAYEHFFLQEHISIFYLSIYCSRYLRLIKSWIFIVKLSFNNKYWRIQRSCITTLY